ncbi:MAG TPA: adenylate/guanylate cyclase domain-containing protein, partial [Opitutus sp.]|nr:adenylate/guanylate cyclase domain-containing protein [Opitutus sp.]
GAGGVQRQVPLVVRVGRDVWPNLSLQTLMAYYGVPADKVRVRLGDAIYLPTKARGEIRIPIAENGMFLLNYRYDQTDESAGPDFPTYSYLETLVKLTSKFVDKAPYLARPRPDFKGRIVFLGQTVTGKADAGPTPLSVMSPLVLVHANVVNDVLTGDFARRAPKWLVWLGAVAVGYWGLWLGLKRAVWLGATFAIAVVVVYVALAFGAWIEWSLWLPFTGPLLGFMALEFVVISRRVLKEQRGREQVKQMFGTYLSPELLKKMMKGGTSIATVSSERRAVTILFSDLRDFTSLTESVQDDVLIRQLNEYLAAMVECIHRERGTLHKFIGDAVMAVWGDLETAGAAEDAAGAARAALAMEDRLAQLNEKWKAEGLPSLRMGIGLNHGTVLIGNIGSPRRMEFTAIGDAVNLASRLEGLNKQLGTTLLAGERVRELLKDRFEFRPCGSVPVKGKAKPVEVFSMGVHPSAEAPRRN